MTEPHFRLEPVAEGAWAAIALPDRGAVGNAGLVALAASIYMVYLLEIVKLANPRIRRREAQLRKSA